MARVLTCDGCGASIARPEAISEKFDRFTEQTYGACCGSSIAAYYAERDAAHTEASDLFKQRLAAAREKWRIDHPNGRLPDD